MSSKRKGVLEGRLAECLQGHEVAHTDVAVASMMQYLEFMQRWNRTHNLSAIRNLEGMVTLHLLDSLSVLPFLSESDIADLGSGAGVPGIPLAIARPDLQVTLIESNGKKCSFLRAAKRELSLDNIEVVQSRGEAYVPVTPHAVVISRAFSSLADFWSIAQLLIADGGRLLAMKGKIDKPELDALPPGIQTQIHELQVPGLDAERHLIEMKAA